MVVDELKDLKTTPKHMPLHRWLVNSFMDEELSVLNCLFSPNLGKLFLKWIPSSPNGLLGSPALENSEAVMNPCCAFRQASNFCLARKTILILTLLVN